RLPLEHERHGHDRAGAPGHPLAVARGALDLRALEERAIELGGFFSLGVEPKKRGDLLHDFLLYEPCAVRFASEPSSRPSCISQPFADMSVQCASCIVSMVTSRRTPSAAGKISTLVSTGCGATPGTKSTGKLKASRRSGSIAVNEPRWWVATGMPAFF